MNHYKTIIHIGLHKTGSTYLQKEVFSRIKDFDYLTRPYTQLNNAFNKLQYSDDVFYYPDEVREAVSFIDGNLLLSDESFSGKPWKSFNYINRSMIKDRLAEIFPDSTILIVIRNQADMIVSFYSQYLKTGGIKTFREYFWNPDTDFTYDEYQENVEKNGFGIYKMKNDNDLYYNSNEEFVHKNSLDYYPILKSYAKTFPKVEVLLYEDLKYEKEKWESSLSELFNQSVSLPDISINTSKLVHKSYLWANRIANLSGGNKKVRKTLQKSIGKIGAVDKKSFQSIKEQIGLVYRESNLKLTEFIDREELKKYGYI